jgi:predicted ABC-type ATPase
MNERDRPTCWIIAGPNGAGKTTFALKYLPEAGCQNFVNADLIAAGISPLPSVRSIAATLRKSCLRSRASTAR